MSKKRNKKQGAKQNHLSSQALIRHQIITGGLLQQPQLALPAKAKEFMQSLPDEVKQEWKPASVYEVAQMAKVDKRVGLLLSAYYHIHSVQGLLTGEICNWLDGFNLWIKGVRPAMNDVERAEDRFFEAMGKIIDPTKGCTQDEYRTDCDRLYEKLMHWEGIPKHWKPGEPLHLERPSMRPRKEGTIVVDSGHEELVVGTVTLPPEVKETRTAYCVSRLNNDETANVVKSDIKNKGLAAAAANRLAKKDPGHMYVIYEQTIETQEVATLRPIKAAQTPSDGGELVEVDIKSEAPEQEGGQP